MISIIICSRSTTISPQLKDNILRTIGIEYELIVIDNSKNNYSIFSAYNEGVIRAKYPYLCFMHEDIFYHTQNWGEKIVDHFKNTNIGLIGVLGSHLMPKTPSGWYFPHLKSGGVYQGNLSNGKYDVDLMRHMSYLKDDLSIEVVVVDGLWFCTPKSIFSKVRFDTKTFSGFHCYDLDICFQIRKAGLQVNVVSDILIEHFSSGSIDIDWVKDSILLFNKWQDYLPQIAGVNLSIAEMNLREEFVSEIFYWVQKSMENESRLTCKLKKYRFFSKVLAFLKKCTFFYNSMYKSLT